MFEFIVSSWMTNWPPARRRAQAIKKKQQQAAAAAQQREEAAAKERKKREIEAVNLQAYKAHLEAVDFNGVALLNGKPMDLADIKNEMEKRDLLARLTSRETHIRLADKMSDEDIAVITEKLDQTALDWLLEHKDPERQRKAATAILEARANFEPVISLDHYATTVAEAVARSGFKFRPNRDTAAVIGRAILLRSADSRWTRRRQNELRPLTKPHW